MITSIKRSLAENPNESWRMSGFIITFPIHLKSVPIYLMVYDFSLILQFQMLLNVISCLMLSQFK